MTGFLQQPWERCKALGSKAKVYLRPWKWDRLQGFSKQGIVKVTPIMPIIGYLILFNARLQPELTLSPAYVFDPEGFFSGARLYLLYFGLAAMAVSSLWFQARCPPEIKAHGSAYEFINKEEAAVSEFRVKEMLRWVIRHDYGAKLARLSLDLDAAIGLAKHARPQHAVGTYLNPVIAERNVGDRPLNPSQIAEIAKSQYPERFQELLELVTELRSKVELYKHKPELMNVFLVRRKPLFPRQRACITYLYFASFGLLGLPTLEVFIRVSIQAGRDVFGVVSCGA